MPRESTTTQDGSGATGHAQGSECIESSPSLTPAPGVADHDKHTVLIVDDDPRLLRGLRKNLERDGYIVLCAENGAKALEMAKLSTPRIVLADVGMPEMDGYALCRALKAHPSTSSVPVMLVTGHVSDADVDEGVRAGAADYIKKPIDRMEMRFRVRAQIRLHETVLQRRAAEKRLRAISSAAKDAIVMIDQSGAVTHWNEAAESMFGYQRDEALGRDLHQMIAPERHRRVHGPAFAKFQRTGQGAVLGKMTELSAITRGGDEFPVELSLSSVSIDGAWNAVGIVRDISQRKRSEERYRALFESSQDAIMTLEPPSWKFSSGNRSAVAMFAAKDEEDFISRPLWEYSPQRQPDGCLSLDGAKAMIAAAIDRGGQVFEWNHQRLTGEEFPAVVHLTRVTLDGEPILQATVRDISEQRQVEVELGHARKLEAVGRIAAGIAHEINTPTQFVSDNLRFLKEAFEDQRQLIGCYQRVAAKLEGHLGQSEPLLAEIKDAEERADLDYLDEQLPAAFDASFDGLSRIATIVGAMKGFAHPHERGKRTADINQALLATLTIAKNEYKYVADVETNLGELPLVLCHLSDLNQVFLNLLVNAAHAIRDVVGDSGDRGVIQVGTALEGDCVRIWIKDTGSGIPATVRARNFDPFFTTKEVGKGSGQGLAIAHSIVVDKHGGSLKFVTEEGVGTTFCIRLLVDGHS